MQRKIIHVDMDAFYASVEQRDDPALRGRPVVVAWRGARSVVCAASYEARKFGVHSAMPATRAERLCPQAAFVAPDFVRYKAVSRLVREIFSRYSDLIEPLSLDEAYLDVSAPKIVRPSATAIAQEIREAIRAETRLTASAGVAPNKYLAKIASDWRKPDGLFVIRPTDVDAFLTPLAVGKLPGVGKVMRRKLADMNVMTIGELRTVPAARLEQGFGRWGRRLYELARGIDEHAVEPHRPTLQVSAEDTFDRDLRLDELEAHIRRLAEKTWAAAEREPGRIARTGVLKLKTGDFHVLTRSLTPPTRPRSAAELADIACALRDRVGRPARNLYRLVGVGLAGFIDREDFAAQVSLFGSPEAKPERVG
ncbi:MAG TPA: DNA polymerase IV [Gammaproteobacteria bacterium]|nr:DNA polymerase IV [Gammaproteobacteria bacterium]